MLTLPLAPLVSYVCRWHGVRTPNLDTLRTGPGPDGYATVDDIREWLGGIGHPRLSRWHADGLTKADAEEMADTLRIHPIEVWGRDYYRASAIIGGLPEEIAEALVEDSLHGASTRTLAKAYGISPRSVRRIIHSFTAEEVAA